MTTALTAPDGTLMAPPSTSSGPCHLGAPRCDHGRWLQRCFPCSTGLDRLTPVYWEEKEEDVPFDLAAFTVAERPSRPGGKVHLLVRETAKLACSTRYSGVPSLKPDVAQVDCVRCLGLAGVVGVTTADGALTVADVIQTRRSDAARLEGVLDALRVKGYAASGFDACCGNCAVAYAGEMPGSERGILVSNVQMEDVCFPPVSARLVVAETGVLVRELQVDDDGELSTFTDADHAELESGAWAVVYEPSPVMKAPAWFRWDATDEREFFGVVRDSFAAAGFEVNLPATPATAIEVLPPGVKARPAVRADRQVLMDLVLDYGGDTVGAAWGFPAAMTNQVMDYLDELQPGTVASLGVPFEWDGESFSRDGELVGPLSMAVDTELFGSELDALVAGIRDEAEAAGFKLLTDHWEDYVLSIAPLGFEWTPCAEHGGTEP